MLAAFQCFGQAFLGGPRVADECAESLGDCLVPVAGDVLVDHRRADAGLPEAGHQLIERRARGGLNPDPRLTG